MVAKMKFSVGRREVKEIIISAVVLSAAFGIAFSDGIFSLDAAKLPYLIGFSFVAVGIGFLAHELIGHKITAQHFGMHAEYRMWRFGLAIAIISSLFGFVFAAPGAVYIASKVDLWGQQAGVSKKRMGIVSAMGPAVNLVLALAFIALGAVAAISMAGVSLFFIAAHINIWLAIFNLLPVPPLDGSKVFAWNRVIWLAFFAGCIALFVTLVSF